ncbi:STRN3, partial [Symbiodinium pilosum]
KDKYEKNLLWYYVDISYKGTRTEEDKETLKRQTDLGEGTSSKVPLGLARAETKRGGAAPPSDSSEGDDDISDDNDDDDDGESSSKDGKDSGDSECESRKKPRGKAKSKGRKNKRKRDELEEEMPDEDMDGVPQVLDEILKQQKKSKLATWVAAVNKLTVLAGKTTKGGKAAQSKGEGGCTKGSAPKRGAAKKKAAAKK